MRIFVDVKHSSLVTRNTKNVHITQRSLVVIITHTSIPCQQMHDNDQQRILLKKWSTAVKLIRVRDKSQAVDVGEVGYLKFQILLPSNQILFKCQILTKYFILFQLLAGMYKYYFNIKHFFHTAFVFNVFLFILYLWQ